MSENITDEFGKHDNGMYQKYFFKGQKLLI